MRVALKIILLTIILVVALIPGFGIITILFTESLNFEWTMLVPFGLSILGILSFIYHIKTVSIYKLLDKKVMLPKPNKLFWGLNLAFGASLLLIAIWFLYLIVQTFGNLQLRNQELTYFFGFVGVPLLLGGIIFFEAYYTNEKLKQNKITKTLLDIDNIKGESDKN